MEFSVLTAPRYDVRFFFDVCLSALVNVNDFYRPGSLLFFVGPQKAIG